MMDLRLRKGIRNNVPDWRLYVNGIIRMRVRRIVGLGDLVELITQLTGIKWLVKKIKPDCGCERRKDKLNKIKLWN